LGIKLKEGERVEVEAGGKEGRPKEEREDELDVSVPP